MSSGPPTPAPFPAACLSIGAADSSGATGVYADLKTFTALNTYGAAALTAVGAMRLSGRSDWTAVPESHVHAQLDAVMAELPIVAVKVGILPSVPIVRVVARWLRARPQLRVVIDPSFARGAGGIALQPPEVILALSQELLPRATLITPNRFEAAALASMEECLTLEDMEDAARTLSKRFGCAVLVTGGGMGDRSLDVLGAMDGLSHFSAPTHQRRKVAGSGGAHSAAIAASLAKGESMRESIMHAKLYVSAAIAAAPELPGGQGVLWHPVTVREQFVTEIAARDFTPMGTPILPPATPTPAGATPSGQSGRHRL